MILYKRFWAFAIQYECASCCLVLTLGRCRAQCWHSASWWWHFVYVGTIADILLRGDDTSNM